MLVYDNFFPEDLAEKILAPAHKLPLKGGWKSNSKLEEDPGHWNHLVIGSGKEPRGRNFDCQQDPSFVGSDCYLLWDVIMKKRGLRRLCRAYFNGYTFGTDGYYHEDAYTLIDDKEYSSTCLQESILCYSNTECFPNWGGQKALLKDSEIGYSILPKFNRVVVFDGTI